MARLGLLRAGPAARWRRWWVVGLVGACGVGVWGLALWGPAARSAAGQVSTAPTPAHPGKAVFDRHCATCHGATGGSDGPGAAALPIKPPPLTAGRLLNPLSDDFLTRVVRDGAGSVGLAPEMAAFGGVLGYWGVR